MKLTHEFVHEDDPFMYIKKRIDLSNRNIIDIGLYYDWMDHFTYSILINLDNIEVMCDHFLQLATIDTTPSIITNGFSCKNNKKVPCHHILRPILNKIIENINAMKTILTTSYWIIKQKCPKDICNLICDKIRIDFDYSILDNVMRNL